MKRLIIYHPSYGHIDVKEGETVQTGTFAGLNIEEAFKKIVTEGYGERKLKPLFGVDMNDGTSLILKQNQVGDINLADVNEITVMSPFSGG